MNDAEDGSRYPPKPYSFNRPKFPVYSHPTPTLPAYAEELEDDDDDDVAFDNYSLAADDSYRDCDRHPKKRKLKTASGYEYTMSGANWSEHGKFVLLEVWGDKFLQLGRKSLRNDDWVDVAEKVTDALNIEVTNSQCRQILDELKRKYKKEKTKVEKMGFSNWAFFKKMDMLLMRQECGLACGLDSGEFVFMDTRVYLDRSNRMDELRDSPYESEIEGEEEEDDAEEETEEREVDDESIRMLADTVQRFGRIYEKIESSKREQMRELERMRVEFCKELEVQKKQILEKAQAEIAKIREGDDEEETEEDSSDDSLDDSVENGTENLSE